MAEQNFHMFELFKFEFNLPKAISCKPYIIFNWFLLRPNLCTKYFLVISCKLKFQILLTCLNLNLIQTPIRYNLSSSAPIQSILFANEHLCHMLSGQQHVCCLPYNFEPIPYYVKYNPIYILRPILYIKTYIYIVLFKLAIFILSFFWFFCMAWLFIWILLFMIDWLERDE